MFSALFGSGIAFAPAFLRYVPLYLLLGFVVLFGGFSLVFLLACLCERQLLTNSLEPLQPQDLSVPTPYWRTTRADAMKIGLVHAGDFKSKKKSAVIKGYESLFATADRLVVISIESSSVAGAKLKRTTLRSKFANGRVFESCDNFGTTDLSAVIARTVLLNAGIAELLEMHLGRIRGAAAAPIPFDSDKLLQGYQQIDLDRGARLVLLGLA